MRAIVTSRAYQLSSRYNGDYDTAWDTLFARHFVRRLWAEEVHDAVAQSSNILPKYTVAANGTLTWAMQFPEPLNTPTPRDPVTGFLDAFLRGNRDDETRSSEGSISQALDLMNEARTDEDKGSNYSAIKAYASVATALETLHLNALPAKADIVLAFDTTGSMGDAIVTAKSDSSSSRKASNSSSARSTSSINSTTGPSCSSACSSGRGSRNALLNRLPVSTPPSAARIASSWRWYCQSYSAWLRSMPS